MDSLREKYGKVALLITGGGSRGPIQTGFLKAFQDSGFYFDAIYAGSVGALNGLLFAQDQLAELENLWMTLQNKDVYTNRVLSLWKLLTNDASIYNSDPLELLIRKHLNYDLIKNYPKPFIVNTTNLSTMKPLSKDIRTLDYESCVKFIRASASPPILFPSVTYGQDELVDCGLTNNYFIVQASNEGYDTLFCMTPTNAAIKPLKNLLDIVQATISVSSYNYLDREIDAINEYNKDIAVANKSLPKEVQIRPIRIINFRPDVPWDQPLVDFNYKVPRTQLIENGYNIGQKKIKEFLAQD